MAKGKAGKSPTRAQDYGYSAVGGKGRDYASNGVKENNIFQLPGSDWQLLTLVTTVATAVRLFRLYQPSSVVFDEVQCVNLSPS